MKFEKQDIPSNDVNIAAKLCSATYQNVIKPEETIQSLMLEYGFDKDAFLWFDIPETDTQAILVVIESKIYLAFQGTQTAADWGINALMDMAPRGRGNWHLGFYTAANKAYQIIAPSIHELLKIYPTAEVVVTGHSLGGALAHIFTELLRERDPSLKVKCLITFAQPRIGNQLLIEELQERGIPTFRFFNEGDAVPDLPPASRWAEWYHNSGILLTPTTFSIDTALYDKQYLPRFIARAIEFFINRFFAKKSLAEIAGQITALHSMTEYERRITAHFPLEKKLSIEKVKDVGGLI